MSVLIKGMDMPESCDQCQFCDDRGMCIALEIDLLGDGEELENSWYIPEGYKSNRCPLVEVPTPHGRLIDLDEALKRLPENYDKHDLMYVIAAAPTIIEAEEEA